MFQKVYFCSRKTSPNSSILYHTFYGDARKFFVSAFVYTALYEI